MARIVAVAFFHCLIVNAKRLEEFGHLPPRIVFEIEEDEKGNFSSHYPEADETFNGNSIEEVIDKIKKFQESDATVASAGKVTITKLNIPKEI